MAKADVVHLVVRRVVDEVKQFVLQLSEEEADVVHLVVRRVVDEPVKQFVLQLSEEEATVLSSLLYRVGGPPAGPRGKLQQVFNALEEAGVRPVPLTLGYAFRRVEVS